jgi:1,4-alpha-glucan branching enzyme
LKNESDKVIVFERAGLVWVFNFNPTQSFPDYRIGIEVAGTYRVILSTDDKAYGGFERILAETRFFTTPFEWNGRKNFTQVYIPTRTAMVRFSCFVSWLQLTFTGSCSGIDAMSVYERIAEEL